MEVIESFFVDVDRLLKKYLAEEVFFQNGSEGVLIDSRGCRTSLEDPVALPNGLQWNEFLMLLADVSKCRVNEKNPTQGGIHLSTSIRWHMVMAPLMAGQFLLVCRRHIFHSSSNHLPSNWDDFSSEIEAQHKALSTIIIFGASGSGKTTFLHSLMCKWLTQLRAVIIEKFEEIPVSNPFWSKLRILEQEGTESGRAAFHVLVGAVLRLRPQSIIIGETRLTEIELLGWLSNTGHGGVWTTMHASSLDQIRHSLAPLTATDFPKNSIFGIGLRRLENGRTSIAECGFIN